MKVLFVIVVIVILLSGVLVFASGKIKRCSCGFYFSMSGNVDCNAMCQVPVDPTVALSPRQSWNYIIDAVRKSL